MTSDFQRIAIVNRGEAAMRLIHAVREYNRDANLDLRTIAIHTDPDRRAMFVREADEAWSLGPASFVDPRDGGRKNAYLNYEALERVLVDSRAEAVWVGWGFVAEHPEFADLCKRLGIVFMGPDGDVMRRLGDKITSKLMAEQAGVPVAAWSGGPVASLGEARQHAERIGYPLMVKATAGGGGRGIRSIASEEELEDGFQRARSEALKGFGDATVFMERLMTGARHIEVQVIADAHGSVWPVGVRDCSIQRRHQKLIEESSSPVLTDEEERDVLQAAARLCRAAGYTGAGTVEFLYDLEAREFAFMEVNARLQVEHPVTEMSTDLDLVKLQIHVARGGRLEGDPPPSRGVAIEVRLNAEDPDNEFAPAPGRIDLLRLPTGAGVRVDTGVETGDRIPAEFDSMIAKIIAHGRDRAEAISRLRRALSELGAVISGGMTNRAFLLDLLGMPEVVQGSADVGWLDRSPPSAWKRVRPYGQQALVLAAIEAYEAEFAAEGQIFLSSAARGRPRLPAGTGRTFDLRLGGQPYRLRVCRYGDRRYCVSVDDQRIQVDAEPINGFERRLAIAGRIYRTLCMRDGFEYLVEVDGVPHRISRGDTGIIRSPAPAIVVKVMVEEGQEIQRGDTLAILEAMKMELRVASPFGGTIGTIDVVDNEQVDAGAPLLRLQPDAEQPAADESTRLGFENLRSGEPGDAEERCLRALETLSLQALGFDVDETVTLEAVVEYQSASEELEADNEALIQAEDLLLRQFSDVLALARREPEPGSDDGSMRYSPQQAFYTYLRAVQARGEGLPRSFLDLLRRALAHYRIDDLEPTSELEEVLLWLCKAQSRMKRQEDSILAVLARRLRVVERLRHALHDESHRILDRLIEVSQGQSPAVTDLAREVHYEFVNRPLFAQSRDAAYAEAEAQIEQLTRDPSAIDREALIGKLVANPQPMMTLVSQWYERTGPAARAVLLECMTRRYYRIRDLESLRVMSVGGRPVLRAHYELGGRRINLFTTHANLPNLGAAGADLLAMIGDVPPYEDAVVDFYVSRSAEEAERSEEDTVARVTIVMNEIDWPRPIRRIITTVRVPGAGLGMTGQRVFTFRQTPAGFVEDALHRGLHPMMAKRLQLWQLENFSLERLPSPEDVYLLHGVARENPRDERLFGVAEVRDLTMVHDEAGNLMGVPHLERMFHETLAGIRLYQSQLPARRRLHWNRVLLYVWPPVRLRPGELAFMIRKLMPATRGLGLEKVIVRARIAHGASGELRDTSLEVSLPAGRDPVIEFTEPREDPVEPLTRYQQLLIKMRQRRLHYPYEIVRLLTPSREGSDSDFPPGQFIEHDLDDQGRLVPVERAPGGNAAGIVVGLIRNYTTECPEGMERVIVLGDPSRGMGALAEPECARIIAALDLAADKGLPVEWFAVSAGAKIAMDSGTENLDWTARVLRRLIEFTQGGGEVNVIVHNINVGAQSYWNAEATMLMHTRGILIMTGDGAMVLTGKQALDYSGGVSAEDNIGIGGYDRIMGPNGQAQYWAPDLEDACKILFRHYAHCYVPAGERFPRRRETADPCDRDISRCDYDGPVGEFASIGEIFSDRTNPGRKLPFAIRPVMHAVIDQDSEPLERWSGMRDAEIGVVWEAQLGGQPVCLVGLESYSLPRAGVVPADGPDHWTAGTLFPQSSRKVARAINAASGNRPLVVLANLSGFDGSPESMRLWQLEYGAEIGRAVVNFRGPIVFCVVSRYHGGAFVVFSKSLNANMEVAALEGAFASVIGGAPAAGVVFAREVRAEADADPRVKELAVALTAAEGSERARLRGAYDEVYKLVHNEKRAELASRFDAVHSVQRAVEVGSVDRIVPASGLRPYLIEAIERGMQRELGSDIAAVS